MAVKSLGTATQQAIRTASIAAGPNKDLTLLAGLRNIEEAYLQEKKIRTWYGF